MVFCKDLTIWNTYRGLQFNRGHINAYCLKMAAGLDRQTSPSFFSFSNLFRNDNYRVWLPQGNQSFVRLYWIEQQLLLRNSVSTVVLLLVLIINCTCRQRSSRHSFWRSRLFFFLQSPGQRFQVLYMTQEFL